MEAAVNNENLSFTLDGDEALSFDLSSESCITIDVSTPHVLEADVYQGSHDVTPKTYEQTLETKRKFLADDITIREIPYFETSNDADGKTVYIANTMA